MGQCMDDRSMTSRAFTQSFNVITIASTRLEFSTNDLLQPLNVVGSKRQSSDGSSQYYVQLNVFLKAEGPQNSVATWTFSIDV